MSMDAAEPLRQPDAPAGQSVGRLVVGCGYLGMRVAERWLATGSRVWAVTRNAQRAAQLAAAGIEPIIADVTDAAGYNDLPTVATVFWAVGFDRAGAASYHDVHVGGLGRLLDSLPGKPRVIVSSSTGVWADEDGQTVNEKTPTHPTREAGQVLLAAESVLRCHRLGPGVVLRFAGLYGPDRLPRLTELKVGKPVPVDPNSWLNLIHVDDAAQIVCAVSDHKSIDGFVPRPLYVVSDGVPVRRRDWYGLLAALTGSPPPAWDTQAPRSRGTDKRVDPSLLFGDFSLTLQYPDSLYGIKSIIG